MKDVKRILSTLWIARMLSSLQGDSTRLFDKEVLNEMIEGTTEIQATDELLLVMSILMSIPIFMSFLSLTLPYKTNRYANLGVGIFFVAFEIIFMITVYLNSAVYEIFWGLAYLIFAALVVWYAWNWKSPKSEGSPQ